MSNMNLDRRSFLTAGTLGLAGFALSACGSSNASGDASATAAAASTAASTAAAAEGNVTSGTVTTFIDMTSYDEGKKVRAWLPVPQDFDHQTVTSVAFSADKATKASLNEDEQGNKMLYVEWDETVEAKNRTATLSFHATREEAVCPELVEEGEPGDDVAAYLEGSAMVPVNDQVIAAADEICAGKETVLDKARAIYDWIIENMNRDESVTGCGTGDVCTLLSTKAGKCTDINSVFVGLCRAVGIPAREMFGVRMNAAKITGNQHCWAEFYLPGTGWVSADPADVLKAVLKNNWDKDSDECKEKAEYYWGNLDSERVELTAGRDLTLNPAQDDVALNDFGYPYAEVDGSPVDYYDAASFSYGIYFAADAE